jgi:protein-export chaperone SecB
MLARELQRRGRRVAILSRGYKSVPRPFAQRLRNKIFKHLDLFPPRIVSNGKDVLLDSRRAGDEPHMLAKNLPGVCVLVDKDRVKSGLHALRHFDSDVLLLDDGLQYQRLRHRIDVVLVDSQAPFGNEHLLPRGTLREPPAIDLQLDVQARPIQEGENVFEVTLDIRADAKVQDQVCFIAELTYCGIFTVNVEEVDLEPVLLVECPRLLFPFARNILAEVTRDGGFPPVFLNPIDFVALWQSRRGQAMENPVGNA